MVDAKIIDWFVLDWRWSDNLNLTNTWTKQERQTTPHKDDEQTKVALWRQNHKIKNKIDMKITYFNKKGKRKMSYRVV